MQSRDLTLAISGGRFAARDFGGTGRDVLLVHGTGHNLEVWTPLAELLTTTFHVFAFDMRGHGLTDVDSTDAEHYWQDLHGIVSALGLDRPLLIGHSTGAYAVTAYAADGGDCAGLVLLDGFVLDERLTAEQAAAWQLSRENLWDRYRYGWLADEAEMNAFVAAACGSNASGDNAGLAPELVAAYTRRAFRAQGGGYLRRPTLDDLEAVCRNDVAADIYPAREVYARVHVPAGFVLAGAGPYAARRAEIEAIVAEDDNRWFAEIPAGHNLHMQAPAALAALVEDKFASSPV